MVICGAFHPGIFPENTRNCSPGASWHIWKSPLSTQLMELLPLRIAMLSSTIVPDSPRKQMPSWLSPQSKTSGIFSRRQGPVPGAWVRTSRVQSFQVTQPTWLDEGEEERAQSSSKVQSCSITVTIKESMMAVFHILIIVCNVLQKINGDSMGKDKGKIVVCE